MFKVLLVAQLKSIKDYNTTTVAKADSYSAALSLASQLKLNNPSSKYIIKNIGGRQYDSLDSNYNSDSSVFSLVVTCMVGLLPIKEEIVEGGVSL